jgi:hypothetical protein
MIVFSLLCGVITYTFSNFGMMLTYLGMTGPKALFALISWLRKPAVLTSAVFCSLGSTCRLAKR